MVGHAFTNEDASNHSSDHLGYWYHPAFEEFAMTVLRGIIGNENGITKQTLPLEEVEDFFYVTALNLIWNSITRQSSVTAAVVIGCILTSLSTFTAAIVYFCSLRNKSLKKYNLPFYSRRRRILLLHLNKVKVYFIILGIFVSATLVVIGSVTVLFEARKLRDWNNRVFDILQSSVIGVYMIKDSLINKLRKIPTEIERILIMNLRNIFDISQRVTKKFLNETKAKHAQKMSFLSIMVDNNVRELYKEAKFSQIYHRKMLEDFRRLRRRVQSIAIYANVDTSDIENSALLQTINAVKESVKNIRSETYTDFENILSLKQRQFSLFNIPANFSYSKAIAETFEFLYIVPMMLDFDPGEMLKHLRWVGKQLIQVKEQQIEDLTSFLHWLLPDVTKSRIIMELEISRKHMAAQLKLLDRIFPYTAAVALSITFPIIVGTMIGFCGTNCFEICSNTAYKRNTLSNSGGNILESALYIASLFVWAFCFLSVLLFIIAIVPTNICSSMETMSIAEIPMKYLANDDERSPDRWFSTTTLKDVLENCYDDSHIVRSFNVQDIHDIAKSDFRRAEMNMSGNFIIIDKYFSQLPLINMTSIKSTYSYVIKEYPESVRDYSKLLNQIANNLSFFQEALESTKNYLRSVLLFPDISPLILKNLRSAAIYCEEALIRNKHFTDRLLRFSKTYETFDLPFASTVKEQLEELFKLSLTLNDFIANDAERNLLNIISFVSNESVEGLIYSLEYTMHSIEVDECNSTLMLYARATFFACHLLLQPLAAIWLALCIISLFLFTTILSSIPAASLFKFSRSSRSRSDDRRVSCDENSGYDFSSRRRLTLLAISRMLSDEKGGRKSRTTAAVKNGEIFTHTSKATVTDIV